MYQALYRKWRPKTFSEVVGQEHITSTLQHQVAEGRIGHAYLFTGTRGTGKTTCARILAKAVNCENPEDGAPCCRCDACLAIDNGTLLDVTELDAASNNGVDNVRSLREDAIYTPTTHKRVYIIDEVHALSKDAFNALLKILEEPPEHLLFILATTELQKVPATILSRCQRFSFKRILPRDIQRQLLSVAAAEHIDLTADGAELLSHMANGAMRDALSLLDQCRVVEHAIDASAILELLGLAGSVQTVQLMRCLLARNTADALSLFDQLYRSGKDTAALLSELSDLTRDMTILCAAPDGGQALLTGLYDRKTLAQLIGQGDMRRFLYMTETLQRTLSLLGSSVRPRTEAELCLLRLCDETLSGDLTALTQRVAALENGSTLARTAAPKTGSTVPKATPPAKAAPPVWEGEAPPPLEQGERVYDIPADAPPVPKPVKPAASAPVSVAAQPVPAPVSGGDSSVWTRLIDYYKGRLSVNFRVFLNMASGTLEGDCLRVTCPNDFVKDSINNESVLSVLREVTSNDVGFPVRVELRVGAVPKNGGTPPAAPKAQAKPAAVKPAAETAPPAGDAPPWEDAAHDALDALLTKGEQLNNFKIK